MCRQSHFFLPLVLSAQTCRFPDQTKKNPRTENYPRTGSPLNAPPPPPHPTRLPKKETIPSNFRAVKFFRRGLNDMARQKMESNSLLLPYSSTIFWTNLFSSDSLNCAASIVPAQYSTSQIVLNFPWESYLNQGSKKRLYIYLHICQIFLLPKKSPNEKYQNKKEIPLSSR